MRKNPRVRYLCPPKNETEKERLLFVTNKPGDWLVGHTTRGFRITGIFEVPPEEVDIQICEAVFEVWGVPTKGIGPVEFK